MYNPLPTWHLHRLVVILVLGRSGDRSGCLEVLLEEEVSLEEPRSPDFGFVRNELGSRDIKDLCSHQS